MRKDLATCNVQIGDLLRALSGIDGAVEDTLWEDIDYFTCALDHDLGFFDAVCLIVYDVVAGFTLLKLVYHWRCWGRVCHLTVQS
jgi:hypothetical protein